ncbi:MULTISPECIES: hypothetical protein [unclassified Rhodococcus (in: high G+C Gram-positive bacteria)]|uniref:hypothetical protein n=1 Tax=Rhodococcus sp. SJ-3 TaxID=3454628 RepID=UPI003F78F6A1
MVLRSRAPSQRRRRRNIAFWSFLVAAAVAAALMYSAIEGREPPVAGTAPAYEPIKPTIPALLPPLHPLPLDESPGPAVVPAKRSSTISTE